MMSQPIALCSNCVVRGSVWPLLSTERTSFAGSLPLRTWFAVSFPQAALSQTAVISLAQLVSLGRAAPKARLTRSPGAPRPGIIEFRRPQRWPIANNRILGRCPGPELRCAFGAQIATLQMSCQLNQLLPDLYLHRRGFERSLLMPRARKPAENS